MSYYPIEQRDIDNARLRLTAEKQTLEQERGVLTAISEIIPTYGYKIYNKRFVDFLNVRLADLYGTKKIEDPYKDGPTEYAIVHVWLTTETYSTKHVRFSYGFSGYDIHTEYNHPEPNSYSVGPRNKQETLYNADSIENLETSIRSRLEAIDNSVEKIKANLRRLTGLATTHNKLIAAVNEYNDSISYVISDGFRIK